MEGKAIRSLPKDGGEGHQGLPKDGGTLASWRLVNQIITP